jgi:hypothetical protein
VVNIVEFLAYFPDIQSAIKINGVNSGMRIQLDIPETEMANAIELLALRGQVVKVTIEPEKEPETEKQKETEKNATLQAGAKRQSQWKTDEK